jgi:Leucine-rich repeat (LRR) protein
LIGLAEVSSKTFADCRSLESLKIQFNSLKDLPDGFFSNQINLQDLELGGENIKLSVNAFEGLQSLSILKLWLMDLNQIEENFFHKLNIKRLEYNLYRQSSHAFTFPIESLKSHKTLEELLIYTADLSQLPEDFFATLRTLKLKTLVLTWNMITSAEAFVDLPNVERIDLSVNDIKELPANSFSGCPKLTHLILIEKELFFHSTKFNIS